MITIKSGGAHSSRLVGMFVLRAALPPFYHFMGLFRSTTQDYFPCHMSIINLCLTYFIQWSRSFNLSGMTFLLPAYPTGIFIGRATLPLSISDEGVWSYGWGTCSLFVHNTTPLGVVINVERVAPPKFWFTTPGEGRPSPYFVIEILPLTFKKWHGEGLTYRTTLWGPRGHNYLGYLIQGL